MTHWSFVLKSDFDHARTISEVILDSRDSHFQQTTELGIACQFPAVSWGSPTQREKRMSFEPDLH